IKVAMPVLAEKRDPDFTVSIEPTSLSSCIKPNLKEVLIRNTKTGELSNILKYFYGLLRIGQIDLQNGGVVKIPASDWEMVTSASNEQFERLQIAYRFVPMYYLGMVPAIEGKGILDVQRQMLTFNNMFLQPINMAEIQDK